MNIFRKAINWLWQPLAKTLPPPPDPGSCGACIYRRRSAHGQNGAFDKCGVQLPKALETKQNWVTGRMETKWVECTPDYCELKNTSGNCPDYIPK